PPPAAPPPPAARPKPDDAAPPPPVPVPVEDDGPSRAPQGFGSFIKGLVEKAVVDPAERAEIYAEALRHVEQALARHASEATHRLLMEKQGIVNERVRAEGVLTTVAQGKVIVDQEGRVLMMDSAAEEIVGKPFASVAGKRITEGVEGEEQFVVLSKELVLPENGPVSAAMQTAGGADAMSAFRQSVAVVHDEKGRVVGTYAVLPHAAKYRETQRLQEEFVANVTHDLKAPLTAVCSALEVLVSKLGATLPAEDAEFLDICVRNSRTLRQMIDEILDFSKIASGRMSVHPERLAVETGLHDCVVALLPWARSKRVALEIAPPESPLPPVLADRVRLQQILNNLVSNAIKYTPEGGRVTLSARPGGAERPGTVVVSVADTGCGVAPEDRARIFERFSQGRSTRREGVGLGLTIVRDLVAQHRGELWLDSEPGKGAVFSFSLPSA
ncbi:MAG: ATP-binding protein, partial [Elusimicrobiota bacterium]|nr:ATP-binding protein [Elusimicrobiota bacterium]